MSVIERLSINGDQKTGHTASGMEEEDTKNFGIMALLNDVSRSEDPPVAGSNVTTIETESC